MKYYVITQEWCTEHNSTFFRPNQIVKVENYTIYSLDNRIVKKGRHSTALKHLVPFIGSKWKYDWTNHSKNYGAEHTYLKVTANPYRPPSSEYYYFNATWYQKDTRVEMASFNTTIVSKYWKLM